MNLQVEIEKEEDNRWIAEIPALPGVLAYGITPQEAIARAKARKVFSGSTADAPRCAITSINTIFSRSSVTFTACDQI